MPTALIAIREMRDVTRPRRRRQRAFSKGTQLIGIEMITAVARRRNSRREPPNQKINLSLVSFHCLNLQLLPLLERLKSINLARTDSGHRTLYSRIRLRHQHWFYVSLQMRRDL